MAIPKVLWNVARKAGNYCGLYTKKQCVELSTSIGKELIVTELPPRQNKQVDGGLFAKLKNKSE